MTSVAERSGGERAPGLPARRPPDAGAAPLAAQTAELEDRSRFDHDGLEERADLVRRRGNVAEAGRAAEEIHRWAADRGLLAARLGGD